MQHLFSRARHASHWFGSLIGILCAVALLPGTAQAGGLIRDAEIEHTLRTYSDPIFEAAGLTPSAIAIYIVNDESINAFVSGGSNIFIHTGLILECPTPDMLIGVIAHETGHIAGGHLIEGSQAMEKAQLKAMMGYLLGAAAVAGGASDVGAAVMSAGNQVGMRGLFSHTRANEQAADQSALEYLKQLHITANGMLRLFEVLRKYQNRKMGSPDPYTQTHPLSKERIMHIRNHIMQADLPENAVPQEYTALQDRMLGKLEGFLDDPARTLSRYPVSDTSIRARYARAVAYYRSADTAKATAELETLLATSPNDGYFHELKGQILFEGGQIAEAQKAYAEAARLLPGEPLVRTEMGRVLLANESKPSAEAAIPHLEYATSAEKDNPSAWRLLATAYGRTGRLDLSYLALAEEAIALNKPELAIPQLDAAEKIIAVGSPASLRLQDLKQQARKLEREKDEHKT